MLQRKSETPDAKLWSDPVLKFTMIATVILAIGAGCRN